MFQLCNLMGMQHIRLHYLLEFVQTHVSWVGDAIQPSHSLSPTSPPALNISKHQGLFQWLSILNPMPKVLQLQCQHQSFQYSFRVDFFRIEWFDFLPIQGTLQEYSLALQFKSINSSALSLLYGPAFTSIHDYWKNHSIDYIDLGWQSDVSAF